MVPDLYMQNHFGGTVDYMFNGKFGITGGAHPRIQSRKRTLGNEPCFRPCNSSKKEIKDSRQADYFHIFAF